MFRRLSWIKPNAFSITFQNTEHIYGEPHLESGMADGKDTHGALDNPGAWQKPDCSLTLLEIPCLFLKKEVFLSSGDIRATCPRRLSHSKGNTLHPSPYYQSNWYFHLSNHNIFQIIATVPLSQVESVRIAGLKKPWEMQKVIFLIPLQYVFATRLQHSPYKCDLSILLATSRDAAELSALLLELLALLCKNSITNVVSYWAIVMHLFTQNIQVASFLCSV